MWGNQTHSEGSWDFARVTSVVTVHNATGTCGLDAMYLSVFIRRMHCPPMSVNIKICR